MSTSNRFKELAWIKDGDCIRCISHRPNNYGYPMMQRNGNYKPVARFIMFRKYGEQPTRIDTRHTCDNAWCINPFHILKGTHAENVQDMMQRGRNRSGRLSGECSSNHKLTLAEVQEIRRSKGITQKALAEQFGVKQPCISAIIRRKLWREEQCH